MKKCHNYQECRNYAEHGHDLCSECQKGAKSLTDAPVYIDTHQEGRKQYERKHGAKK
jgi:hypothetical protein